MPGRHGTLEERFWRKVDKRGPDECWLWTATPNQHGYGRISSGSVNEQSLMAHRVAYEMLVGPIPDGLTLDHLCRNRLCVNPAHLEPVTNAVNILRGECPTAINARKTHCKYGHAFTPENVYRTPKGRLCRECHRRNNREWMRKNA